MLQQQPYGTLYTVQSESRLPLLEHVAFYSSILKVKIALVEEIRTRNTLTGCQLSSSSHTHPQYKKKNSTRFGAHDSREKLHVIAVQFFVIVHSKL